MNELIESLFTPVTTPATVLLIIVALYWIITVVSGLGFDLLDFDLDFDTDFDADTSIESMLSVGAVTLRFLNIGELPINLWVSTYASSFWMISMLWQEEPTTGLAIATIIVRNGALALLPTKLLTQPLRGKFVPIEPDHAKDLIDRTGVVTTAEVSPRGGQARFESNASPLLLNVRTEDATIAKGEQVRIVDYDPDATIYTVEEFTRKNCEE